LQLNFRLIGNFYVVLKNNMTYINKVVLNRINVKALPLNI